MSEYVKLRKEPYVAFRSRVRAFFAREVVPHALEWERSKTLPLQLLKKCADEGLLGLSFPVEVGGHGKDFWYEVILAEELASAGALGWALSILVQTNGVAPLVYELGTPEQHVRVLKPAFRGEKYLALAATEAVSGSDIAAIETIAEKAGDQYILSGEKRYITNGSVAGEILVLARISGESGIWPLGLFLVSGNTKGLQRQRLDTIGFKSGDTAILSFNNCKIDQDGLVGKPGRGFVELLKGLQRERLIGAVALNQLSRETIERTLAMLATRTRFGEPLIEKQVIRHRLAELSAEVESSRAFAYIACEGFESGESVDREVVMLKIVSYELCQRIIRECAHLWGGEAFLETHWMSHYYRDALAFTLIAGSAEIMRDLLAGMEQIQKK